ncbi:MAG: hypothetical protein JO279_00340 [Verrucomicrobia bacterium]|nr:hypothetical protein [Verrucomicrobiota bacterium]
MKPYLVSQEVLARQVYRYDPAYRFAAFVFFCFLLAQVPAVAWLVYERQIGAERQERASQLNADAAKIDNEHKALAETEKKLRRIQDLAPILRARLPISAVLGKIEQLAPPDLTVSKISVDAAGFQPLQVETGLFHVPQQIRVAIEGEQRLQDADAYNKLAQALLHSLPPESTIAEKSITGGEHYRTFRLTLIAPTNGNYFGLGVTKIASQNSL